MSEAPERIYAYGQSNPQWGVEFKCQPPAMQPMKVFPMTEYVRADRIEELEAKLKAVTTVRELMGHMWGLAEDKLQRAIDALEKVQAFVRDLEPHADQGHTLAPALREACETLAELKGGIDA